MLEKELFENSFSALTFGAKTYPDTRTVIGPAGLTPKVRKVSPESSNFGDRNVSDGVWDPVDSILHKENI